MTWFRCKKKSKPPHPHGKDVHFAYTVGQPKRKEAPMPLDLTITNEEKIQITVNPVTSTGKPASLDGPISVTVVSGTATVDPIDDRSVFLVSSDTPGDTSFLVEADADLGAGVTTIQDTVMLHVGGAQATSLGLTAGTAVPK